MMIMGSQTGNESFSIIPFRDSGVHVPWGTPFRRVQEDQSNQPFQTLIKTIGFYLSIKESGCYGMRLSVGTRKRNAVD